MTHQEGKNPLNFSPYQKLMYGLNSRESKRQYPKRLQMFLDFIHIKSSSFEEDCNILYGIAKKKDGISRLE